MEKKWLRILALSPLFHNVNPDELDGMMSCLQPQIRGFGKNEYMAAAGTPLAGMGIVLAGEAAVCKESVTGNRTMMAMLQAGDLFGEMGAFAEPKIWPASVLAQSAVTALFLPAEKIVGACANQCDAHRLLVTNLLRIISQKALQLNRKVEYLTMKDLRSKVCTYLLEQYGRSGRDLFVMPLNRNELADFLHVSRVSLSREMGRMREEGLIDFHRTSVKVIDVAALRRMAEY